MTLMNPGYGFFLFSCNLDLVVFFLWKEVIEHDGKLFTKHKIKN